MAEDADVDIRPITRADFVPAKVFRSRSMNTPTVSSQRPTQWRHRAGLNDGLFRNDGHSSSSSSYYLQYALHISSLKYEVVLLQTAHSWANAGVLLGARMHRERGSWYYAVLAG